MKADDEKGLYEIAVGRFLDRLAHAEPRIMNDVILDVARAGEMDQVERRVVAGRWVRALFPEFFEKEGKKP